MRLVPWLSDWPWDDLIFGILDSAIQNESPNIIDYLKTNQDWLKLEQFYDNYLKMTKTLYLKNI